jgi:hypothetical protein
MSRIDIPYNNEKTRARNIHRPVPAEWLAEWKAYPQDDRWRGGAECLFCRSLIRDARAAIHVHLATTGELVTEDEQLTEDEDQGFFPIGPECSRKVPRAYRFKCPL